MYNYINNMILVSFLLVGLSCKQKVAKDIADQKTDLYRLVWSDEFDVDGLPDSTKWNYSVGDGCPRLCGWGNNEQQYYTERETKNARVENGHLVIQAHHEKKEKSNYTSAKLVTKGIAKWLYGKIEVRAKLPSGKGTWPAIWMMPEEDKYGGWPKSGEIDIMEHVGYSPDSIIGTVHTEAFNHILGTQVGKYTYDPDSESAFHTYTIEWDEQKIEWYIDDLKYHTFNNENKSYKEWPFDHPFYLILNLAIGGNWGGKYGVDNSIFPQIMELDYVRVYSK